MSVLEYILGDRSGGREDRETNGPGGGALAGDKKGREGWVHIAVLDKEVPDWGWGVVGKVLVEGGNEVLLDIKELVADGERPEERSGSGLLSLVSVGTDKDVEAKDVCRRSGHDDWRRFFDVWEEEREATGVFKIVVCLTMIKN